MADDLRCGEDEATTLGKIVWHCSEDGGGPDVGMTLGLGGGKALWIGEITNRSYHDAEDDVSHLGGDGGWWLSLIPGFVPVAKFASTEAARDFFDQVSVALATERRATAQVEAQNTEKSLRSPNPTAVSHRDTGE